MVMYECFVKQKPVDSHECWQCFNSQEKDNRPLSKKMCQDENAEKIDGSSF